MSLTISRMILFFVLLMLQNNATNLNLTKYTVAIGNAMNSMDSRNECKSIYGTELASIHNDRDQSEVYNICKSTGTNNCWIGGTDVTSEGNWTWFDGTTWDYHKWEQDEPDNNGNQDCVVLWSGFDLKWNDQQCSDQWNYAICAIPSYLCLHKDWNIIKGNWTWSNTTNCDEIINIDSNAGNIIWYGDNTGNVLPLHVWNDIFIEYMYTMTNIRNYSNPDINGGIIFRAQRVSEINGDGEYYYVGINPLNNFIQFVINRNFIWKQLVAVQLNHNVKEGIYYRLKIEVIDNNFKIYVNEVLYINYTDNNATYYLSFGTIGIRNYYVTTISKYLYASPATYNITVNPTIYPTEMPTVNPTQNPTIYPTQNPTISPTYNTITMSTINPTIYPTQNATISPTYNDINEGGVDIKSTINTEIDGNFNNKPASETYELYETIVILIVIIVVLICITICLVCIIKTKCKNSNYSENVETIVEHIGMNEENVERIEIETIQQNSNMTMTANGIQSHSEQLNDNVSEGNSSKDDDLYDGNDEDLYTDVETTKGEDIKTNDGTTTM
eukprot:276421_1